MRVSYTLVFAMLYFILSLIMKPHAGSRANVRLLKSDGYELRKTHKVFRYPSCAR